MTRTMTVFVTVCSREREEIGGVRRCAQSSISMIPRRRHTESLGSSDGRVDNSLGPGRAIVYEVVVATEV